MENKRGVFGISVIVIILVGVVLIGWLINREKPNNTGDEIKVVTSFYPLYFFATEIGGERAIVSNITPAGAEPHDYEPTARQIAGIEDSKLLILNGGGLEGWGQDITKNLEGSNTKVVVVGDGLANLSMVEGGETETDPHIWLSPLLAESMVDKILAGFVQTDPENTDYYTQNANGLKSKLGELNELYHLGLAECARRDIITSHAAFGYLAATYNLNQVPISGLSPESEPSPKDLVEIAKFAKTNGVKYIFFESLLSPKLSETIATEIGSKTLVLNPLEGLSPEEVSQGKNYFSEMLRNLDNLQIALECQK